MYLIKKFASFEIFFCNSGHSGKYNEKKVGQLKDRLKTYFEVKFELLIVLRNYAQNF
jgi:hypothetical protein